VLSGSSLEGGKHDEAPGSFALSGGFIILIAILRSVTNQLGITPTHLFELGEAFCAPSEQKFFNFFENKKSRLF
jgi:hypothetical protein